MKRVAKTLKKYFIPHPENEHKPHILRPRTVAFVILIAIAVESVFIFGATYLAPRSKLFGIVLVSALVDGTNAARTAANVPTLTENALLDVAAQDKANDMVANNYFAHTSPAGITPWYWFGKVGYDFSSAGENLAVNFSDSSDVTTAWLDSAEHRANILNAGFTEIGMATAQGTYQGHTAIYVVELFASPAPTFDFGTPALAATPPARTSTATSTNFIAVTVNESTTPTATISAAPIVSTADQANLVQTTAANPVHAIDYLYLALALVFALALTLNIFIKIKIQYAPLILGGMLVILIAGLFIVLNQHFALAGSAVL
jgi:hypothetical protein